MKMKRGLSLLLTISMALAFVPALGGFVALATPTANGTPSLTLTVGEGSKALSVNNIAVATNGGSLEITGANSINTSTATVTHAPTYITVTPVAAGTTQIMVDVKETIAETPAASATSLTGTISVDITVEASNDQSDIDAVKNWLSSGQNGWNAIRSGNTTQNINHSDNTTGNRYQVTSNLSLQTNSNNVSGISGTAAANKNVAIAWAVSGSGLTNAGVVNATTSQQNVTLTATLTKGTVTNTTNQVVFYLTVAPGDNAVNAVHSWLTWDRIRSDNAATPNGSGTGSRAVVMSNLSIPSIPTQITPSGVPSTTASDRVSIPNTVSISWSVVSRSPDNSTGGNIAVNRNTTNSQGSTGTVTIGTVNTTLTLRARITNTATSATKDKEFYITVNATNDQAVANAIYNWLQWNGGTGQHSVRGTNATNTVSNRYQITGDLNLATVVPSGNRYLNTSGSGNSTSTGNYTLDTNGFSVQWTTSWSTNNSGANIVTSGSNIGRVTFATNNQNVNVTLTARVYKGSTAFNNTNSGGNASNKSFELTITQPATGDQAAINAAMAWLVWNEIRRGNDASTAARFPTYADLNLPTAYTYKPNNNAGEERTVTITWSVTSGSTGLIATSGTNIGRVTLPNNPSDLTLTAVFTCGSIRDTSTTNNGNSKTFDLTVRHPTNEEAVRAARLALTWDVIRNKNAGQNAGQATSFTYAVASDLYLPNTGECGTTISWSSNNTGVVSNSGMVTIPSSGSLNVILQATITKPASGSDPARSESKEFSLRVGEPEPTVTETPNGITASYPVEHFSILSQNGNKDVTVKMGNICTIKFDAASARTLINAGGNIAISVERITNISESNKYPYAQWNVLAGRLPAYDFTVLANEKEITAFGGQVTVGIPYSPGAYEDENAIVVYNVDRYGETELMRCKYENRQVYFATGHFSIFMIGHVSDDRVRFNDVRADSTMRQHVIFVASRDMFKGYGNGSFGMGDNISRRDFVSVLKNIEGVDESRYGSSRFTDSDGSADRNISWADQFGVFRNDPMIQFRPRDNLNRGDMALWFYNYITRTGITLDKVPGRQAAFTDIGHLSYEHQVAIAALYEWGVISGESATTFNPNGATRREHVAAIISGFVKAFSL